MAIDLVVTWRWCGGSMVVSVRMAVVEQGEGFPVAVLNHNQPAFYCVPAEAFELLMDKLEDMELSALVNIRKDQLEIEVKSILVGR